MIPPNFKYRRYFGVTAHEGRIARASETPSGGEL